MREIILLSFTGEDKPGLSSSITEILAKYRIDILDIGQAVIHNALSLGILAQVPKEFEASPVLKDILFRSHQLGIQVRFYPVEEATYENWVAQQGKPRYIITLLARKITAEHISKVTAIIAANNLNIDQISRLSGRIPLQETYTQTRACIELFVRGEPIDKNKMRASFLDITDELGVDIAFQEDDIFRRFRRLVGFDMDSTLIEVEVIDELAKAAGVGDKVSAITEKAMRGEIDFTESFRRRVGLLEGLDESVLAGIAERLPITEGAERLFAILKTLGFKTAILSGGFTYFARHLQKRLGIDYIYANELEIENGKVTGKVTGQVVDGKRKAELLQEIAKKEGIRMEQVIAVGDGANDLPMLSVAGLGIAFRAKPIVKESAEHSISTLGLDGILYLLGFRDREVA
ncbi:phosphoserine phosphatase SerB [Chloroherpeton thalassium ATCC 35110]|uniref:Phosphoserine phosphatase n=1 Tax=Chloroherpeton thalassium (strain ATCC 35110 / GB-78) TaxID=517418 RepID=B3QSC2_CHLT3|nr:phosphoserine phosphatase SerB [Chloroherpeton thalassium]ACF12513.1 phosphoserine phosphatase SerB [Chloroherpeton thalassium ATCC 35110]